MVWLGLFDFVFMYDGVGAFGGAWSLLFVVMYFFVKGFLSW